MTPWRRQAGQRLRHRRERQAVEVGQPPDALAAGFDPGANGLRRCFWHRIGFSGGWSSYWNYVTGMTLSQVLSLRYLTLWTTPCASGRQRWSVPPGPWSRLRITDHLPWIAASRHSNLHPRARHERGRRRLRCEWLFAIQGRTRVELDETMDPRFASANSDLNRPQPTDPCCPLPVTR